MTDRLPHELDDDGCCIHCGADLAEEWYLRVYCTPEWERAPEPEWVKHCQKRMEQRP